MIVVVSGMLTSVTVRRRFSMADEAATSMADLLERGARDIVATDIDGYPVSLEELIGMAKEEVADRASSRSLSGP